MQYNLQWYVERLHIIVTVTKRYMSSKNEAYMVRNLHAYVTIYVIRCGQSIGIVTYKIHMSGTYVKSCMFHMGKILFPFDLPYSTTDSSK